MSAPTTSSPPPSGSSAALRQSPTAKTLLSVSRGVKKKRLRLMIYGTSGVGKCLAKGTRLIMADGSIRPVEQIRDGDQLMGPDSMPRSVQHTQSGVGALYRITPHKGEAWLCNETHVLTLSKRYDFHHEIVDVALGDLLKMPPRAFERHKLVRTGLRFPDRPTPLDPYFVGLWIAEGSRNSGSVTLTSAEPVLIDYLKQVAEGYGLFFKATPYPGANKARLCRITAYEAHTGHALLKGQGSLFLRALRQCGMKGSQKRIPDCYLYNAKAKRLELLAGLIDAAGSLMDNGFAIPTLSPGLCEQYAYLARSLGFEVTLRDNNLLNKGCGTGLFISGAAHEIPTKLARKQAAARPQLKDSLRTGFSITPQGQGPYYGFELDGDGRFLLGDFTVTHNSTFCSQAPDPVFLCAERGTDHLDVPRFPQARSLEDLKGQLRALEQETHELQTLVIDSLDWLEPLIWQKVCQEGRVESIEDYGGGYGKGYTRALDHWRELIGQLERLSTRMHLVLVAHAEIKAFSDPDAPAAYDRYQLKLNQKAAALLREFCDIVLFARFETRVIKERGAMRARGIGSGVRVMYSEHRPAFDAKNRYGLPFKMPLSWRVLADAVKLFYERGGAPREFEVPSLAELEGSELFSSVDVKQTTNNQQTEELAEPAPSPAPRPLLEAVGARIEGLGIAEADFLKLLRYGNVPGAMGVMHLEQLPDVTLQTVIERWPEVDALRDQQVRELQEATAGREEQRKKGPRLKTAPEPQPQEPPEGA